MKDRRRTERWERARPRTAPPAAEIASTEVPTQPTPTPALTADEQLRGLVIDGRFQIDACIGSGGMSRVYSGLHLQTGVRVAIKLIDPALSPDPATQKRLFREARAMMELQSNHIVRALDVGALPSGQLYVVMDFLVGENLDAVLQREGPLPWARVLAIGLQICNGLATAHCGGIVHRDIKPQNFFRTKIDEIREHIKIIDFGVARELRNEAVLTEQGVLPGTPEYMAPELVKPGVRANERTDIYAVGVTLYKLLTGHVPFQGTTYMETLRRHADESLVLPSLAAPARGIPPEVDDLVARALAKDPAKRFVSADALAGALHAALERASPMISASGSGEAPSKPTPDGTPLEQGRPNPPMPLPVDSHRAQPDVSEPNPSRAAPRALDTRFVLLRMSTLMVVSALFTVGTFVIRPRAEASPISPTAEATPSTAPVATMRDTSRSSPPALVVAAPDPAPETPDGATPSTNTLPPADTKHQPVESPLGDAAAAELPVADDPPIAVDPELPPVADDPPIAVDPELPPVADGPTDLAASPEPTASPESAFGYASARKVVEEQHVYLRNECMGNKAKKPLARLKFRADVRANGLPVISVFSGERSVRDCVRNLFRIRFDSSPRGGAFEYTLTMTTHNLKPVPVDPEKVK